MYDENCDRINFADDADYVTFTYVSSVGELPDEVAERIVNSLEWYTDASEAELRAGAVVREVLHTGSGQTETQMLSNYGLVWALGDDGFLYTAMDGAYKYSGGIGTFVGFSGHQRSDEIIYCPDSEAPYTRDQINANDGADPRGVNKTPNSPSLGQMIRVVDGSGAGISGAAVTLDEAGTPSFSGTTDDDGLLFATLKSSGQALNATVQTAGQESSTYLKSSTSYKQGIC